MVQGPGIPGQGTVDGEASMGSPLWGTRLGGLRPLQGSGVRSVVITESQTCNAKAGEASLGPQDPLARPPGLVGVLLCSRDPRPVFPALAPQSVFGACCVWVRLGDTCDLGSCTDPAWRELPHLLPAGGLAVFTPPTRRETPRWLWVRLLIAKLQGDFQKCNVHTRI